MMRLLAVDTSTWWGSAAVVEDTPGDDSCRVVAQARQHVKDSHAARLIPLIERLLGEVGWKRTSLDAFAAVRGPGSFTGIRVGLGLLRGLSLAAGRPCIGIGTLEAMAEAFGPAPARRLPLMDAGRGELFGALYDADASPPVEVTAPWLAPPARSAELAGAGAVAFGAVVDALAPTLVEAGLQVVAGRPEPGFAAAAGRIAWHRLRAGVPDGVGVSPLYLRPADAELKRRT